MQSDKVSTGKNDNKEKSVNSVIKSDNTVFYVKSYFAEKGNLVEILLTTAKESLRENSI